MLKKNNNKQPNMTSVCGVVLHTANGVRRTKFNFPHPAQIDEGGVVYTVKNVASGF